MSSISWHRLPTSSWMTPGGNSMRRRELARKNELPSTSEIRARLGAPLAHIFFNTMADSPGALNQVGLTPPLKGPGKDLWVSPSDILEGKVALTVPFTSHCRQALTHEAILYSGAQYEAAVEEETNRKIKHTIDEMEKQMKKATAEQVELAIQKTQVAEQEKCKIKLEQRIKEFEEFMKKHIAELEQKWAAEAAADKKHALDTLKEDMETQMAAAVTETEKYLTKKFNFRLTWEASKYFENYEEKIREKQKKWSLLFDEAKLAFEREIEKHRIELEAKHIADIMRIYREKMVDVNNLKEQLKENLMICYNSKDRSIGEKEKIIIEKDKKINIRDQKIKALREKMADLAFQFQKFIQFALKGKPGQGEFLLSIEHLMEEMESSDLEEGDVTMSASQEMVSVVMAIIIDTIMAKFDNGTIPEKPGVVKTIAGAIETFEERVERERAENRAVELINTAELTNYSEEVVSYLKDRISAVQGVFSKYPSVLRLFLLTKSAISSSQAHRPPKVQLARLSYDSYSSYDKRRLSHVKGGKSSIKH